MILFEIPAQLHESLEIINLISGWICDDLCVNFSHHLRTGGPVIPALCYSYGLPQLPVSLTVQLVGSDEYSARLLCGIEKQEICRDSFIVMYFNYISDSHIRRSYLSVLPV